VDARTERVDPDEVALLGTDHDKFVAQKLGRTRSAVTLQRTLQKIRAFSGSPEGGRAWTNEELALLGTDTDQAVAERIVRTRTAVAQKRAALKVPAFRDRRGLNCSGCTRPLGGRRGSVSHRRTFEPVPHGTTRVT
jgi:hypothetical protein